METERNHDIMRAFHELIAVSKHIRIADIFAQLVDTPSHRFWVSEERATCVINKMMQGDDLHYMRPTKRAMFEEIFRRVECMKLNFPMLSLNAIVCRVVREPAPKFYLQPAVAKIYYYRTRKQWYKEKMKSVLH